MKSVFINPKRIAWAERLKIQSQMKAIETVDTEIQYNTKPKIKIHIQKEDSTKSTH